MAKFKTTVGTAGIIDQLCNEPVKVTKEHLPTGTKGTGVGSTREKAEERADRKIYKKLGSRK